jgi:hypothetical protein
MSLFEGEKSALTIEPNKPIYLTLYLACTNGFRLLRATLTLVKLDMLQIKAKAL